MKILTPGTVHTHQIQGLYFGSIPQSDLIGIVSDNRILGQIMETEVASSFRGFSKKGVNPKSETEDLFYDGGYTVQCKAINFNKSISIMKSSLWDTRDGVRRKWAEWDAIHNKFFDDQDYLMIFNTTNFQLNLTVEILFVTPEILRNVAVDETRKQKEKERARRERIYNAKALARNDENQAALAPNWKYPIEVSKELWHNLKM